MVSLLSLKCYKVVEGTELYRYDTIRFRTGWVAGFSVSTQQEISSGVPQEFVLGSSELIVIFPFKSICLPNFPLEIECTTILLVKWVWNLVILHSSLSPIAHFVHFLTRSSFGFRPCLFQSTTNEASTSASHPRAWCCEDLAFNKLPGSNLTRDEFDRCWSDPWWH